MFALLAPAGCTYSHTGRRRIHSKPRKQFGGLDFKLGHYLLPQLPCHHPTRPRRFIDLVCPAPLAEVFPPETPRLLSRLPSAPASCVRCLPAAAFAPAAADIGIHRFVHP